MATNTDTFFCDKCQRTMRGTEFYGSNNLEKYPEGKLHQCKKCLTMHVDNWDSSTYMWILEECDVPYIPEEWNKLLQKYASEGKTITGTTIIGRYLAKMKLKQFRDYRFKDTEFLQQMADHKVEETMKRQGYEAAEIAKVIEQSHISAPERPTPPPLTIPNSNSTGNVSLGTEDYFAEQNSEYDIDIAADLTDDDKRYLLLKWGKSYTPEEWVKLEQLYNEMMQSYDIQSAGHIDNLKLLCKTSLKSNQLLDIGDVDGAQKMLRMYDSLMKSGKFTAAQNKAESGEYVDSISELVAICEKEGFIPRYYIDQPGDRVDETIADLKGYTHSLVVDEMNLGNLIESAVKTMAREEAKEEDEDIEDEIMSLEDVDQLKDEDFEEFNEFEEDEEKASEEAMKEYLEED
jgi:hypothetical protein